MRTRHSLLLLSLLLSAALVIAACVSTPGDDGVIQHSAAGVPTSRTLPAEPKPGEVPPWQTAEWKTWAEAARLQALEAWNAGAHARPARTEPAGPTAAAASTLDAFVPGLGQLLTLAVVGIGARLARPRGRETAGDVLVAVKERRFGDAALSGMAFVGMEHATPDKEEAHARLLESLTRHGAIEPGATVAELLEAARAQGLIPAVPAPAAGAAPGVTT